MSVFHPVSTTQAEQKLRTGLLSLLLFFCATTLGITSTAAAVTSKTVTRYAGQHQQMVRMLINAFETQTGINVKVRYDREALQLLQAAGLL